MVTCLFELQDIHYTVVLEVRQQLEDSVLCNKFSTPRIPNLIPSFPLRSQVGWTWNQLQSPWKIYLSETAANSCGGGFGISLLAIMVTFLINHWKVLWNISTPTLQTFANNTRKVSNSKYKQKKNIKHLNIPSHRSSQQYSVSHKTNKNTTNHSYNRFYNLPHL